MINKLIIICYNIFGENMKKYKIMFAICKILNITLVVILIAVYIFLANGFIEKAIVNKEINNFKERGVYVEDLIINGQTVKMYKVVKAYDYEDTNRPIYTYLETIDDYYLGSKTDITITSRNPMRMSDLAIVRETCGFFANNFYLGHATMNITENGSSYIEAVGNGTDNRVKVSVNSWIATEIRGGEDTNRIVGLRIKNTTSDQRDAIVDDLLEKVDCEYNYNFFIPYKDKYYCTDLLTRTLSKHNIDLNYDGFFAIGNDIILDNDTYLIYYIERIENGMFEFYYLSEE